MADNTKFKSVSVAIGNYNKLVELSKGKITTANLSISKTIESLVTKAYNETLAEDKNDKFKVIRTHKNNTAIIFFTQKNFFRKFNTSIKGKKIQSSL